MRTDYSVWSNFDWLIGEDICTPDVAGDGLRSGCYTGTQDHGGVQSATDLQGARSTQAVTVVKSVDTVGLC